MREKRYNNAIEKAKNISSDTEKVKNDHDFSSHHDYEKEWDDELAKVEQIDRGFLNSANKSVDRVDRKITNADKNMQKLEKLQREEDAKILRMQQKEERLKRREELAFERKKALIEAKRLKADKRSELKEKRERDKHERLEKMGEYKQKRYEKRSSRGIGGWLAAVIALGCACLVLTTILISDIFMSGNGEVMLSNSYARNFYDFVGYVDNIDVNLSKLSLSNDADNQQKILCDLMVQANLAEADLEALPIEQNSKNSTVKFINQVGDFSKYLNNKLIDGDSMSESDIATLKQMKNISNDLRVRLKKLEGELGEDFDFMILLSGEENALLDYFNEMEYHSVEYPKMIYDGPFADEPESTSQETEMQDSEKITEEEAKAAFERYFSDYKMKEVTVIGYGEGNHFSVYNVEGKNDRYSLLAQISTKGELVAFDSYTHASERKYDRDECIANATKFLEKCGYKSIKAVWVNMSNDNMAYINFASVANNGEVVLYADLIKVAVCSETGRVCDMDAHLYLKNHKEREIPEVKIRVEEAELKVSKDIEIETSRLALIPLNSGKEVLAYEFSGNGSDGSYFVYINAVTGKEVQIFKVVSTDDGELLL